MAEVFTLALTFPSVVFTVLLGVVLVYWLFVMAGVLHLGGHSDGALDGLGGGAHGGLPTLGGGSDGALDGLGGPNGTLDALGGGSDGTFHALGGGSDGAFHGLDAGDAMVGATKGAIEGATKGVLEGAADTVIGNDAGSMMGHPHGAEGVTGHQAQVGADVHPGDLGHSGPMAVVLSALRLKQIPATVAVSVLITFSWLVSVVAMQIAARFPMGGAAMLVRAAVLGLSPVLAVPLSSLVCVPLSKAIAPRKPPTKRDLIGTMCRVRTGKVTGSFGEATLEDGGAGLVLRVRVNGQSALKRGDLALIVAFDRERDSFLIEPMERILADGNRG